MDALLTALSAHPHVFLFKHSPICPTSLAALQQWEHFRAEHPEAPTLFVDVIANRALARGLAKEVGVPHASPQAILFAGGQAVWNASHGTLTASRLGEAWEQAMQDGAT